MVDISVLVVNYNTADLVKQCVDSLLMQRDVTFEVIVVDNNSQDHSDATLKAYGSRIIYLPNRDNKGFGTANNQGFKASTGRYIFMLNPDAVCLTELDLKHLVTFMNAHPEFGLIGTRIINSQGAAEHTAFKSYPHQDDVSGLDFSHLPGKLASVLGASMVTPRAVYEAVSGFDEDYFLYAEETDLCLRIRKAGHAIGYVDAVTVQHVGGASEKSRPRIDVIRRKKRGKHLFFLKHYPTQDVRRIARRDLRHARFQLVFLGVKSKLMGLNERQQASYARHQLTIELAHELLARL